jgi:lipopolysaccharide/colanic/teichoic acid biosynthesis glycosyltransferase
MKPRAKKHADSRISQQTPLELPAVARWQKAARRWRLDQARAAAAAPPPPHHGRVYVAVKGLIDRVAALVLLVVTAPAVLLAMALVKLTSPGPAVYSQIRLGKGGRPFRIYKLRTMYHECEAYSGARWSTPGDPRVTPLGHFLRATHLDELPQLWNILRGDMSLIGPRPERPEFVVKLEMAIPHYRARLLVCPGVTGLAQVQLPPDSDVEAVRQKVACDLVYVHNLGWWLDVRILALTALHVFGLPCHGLCRRLLPAHRPADARPAAAAGRS